MSRQKALMSCTALCALVAWPHGASAQAVSGASASAPTQVEEIIVTALKSPMTLQETPATVAVVSGESLVKQDVRDLTGLMSQVPGLVAYGSPNSSGSMAIRGIGSSTASTSFDPSVGIFIDGVFAPKGRDFQTSLFDVASVQVVKGTQAAVLGKNTSVGAVVTTTRRPGSAFGYNISESHEFELGSDNLDAGVDLPISENLVVRLSGRLQRDKGWIADDDTGTKAVETRGEYVRAGVRWTPTDDLDVYAYLQHEHVKKLGVPWEFTKTDSRNTLATEFLVDGHQQESIAGWSTNVPVDDFFGDRALVLANYKLGGYTLTSTTGWRSDRFGDAWILDSDLGRGDQNVQLYRDKNNLISEELRISSPSDGAFKWIAGVLLYHHRWHAPLTTANYWNNPAQCTASSATRFNGQPLPQPNTYGVVACGVTFEDYEAKTNTVSSFAQINWDITDKINLVAGGRYTHEEKDVDVSRIAANGFVSDTGFRYPDINQRMLETRGLIAPGTNYHLKDDAFDPSASLKYRFSDKLNVYVSAGQGTKSGGVQNQNYAQASGAVGTGIYAPERSTTYEAGTKYENSWGHIYGAVFQTRVRNFQNSLFNGVSFTLTQEQLKSKGVELKALVKPHRDLELFASGTYADTRYASGTTPATNVGRPFLRAPLFTYLVKATYHHDLTDNYELSVEPVARFTDNYRFSTNPTIPISPSAWVYDLRVALENKPAGWSVALLGRNLSDEKIISYAFPGQTPGPGIPGGANVGLDRPRTIALQFTLSR